MNRLAAKGKLSDVESVLLYILLEKQTSWEIKYLVRAFNKEAKTLSASYTKIDLKSAKQKHSEAARTRLRPQCEIKFL